MKDINWNMEGLHQVIMKAFLQTNKEIWSSEIDTTLSGSTTVSLLIKKDKVFFFILTNKISRLFQPMLEILELYCVV